MCHSISLGIQYFTMVSKFLCFSYKSLSGHFNIVQYILLFLLTSCTAKNVEFGWGFSMQQAANANIRKHFPTTMSRMNI